MKPDERTVVKCSSCRLPEGVATVWRYVKIFIVVKFSNAMNPQEILPVPSLRRAVVPGPYARSRSVSLGLPRLAQT